MTDKLFLSLQLEQNFLANAQKAVTNEVKKAIRKSLPKIQKTMTKALRLLVRQRLVNTPEYQSIVGGTLRGELGLPDGQRRITTIIEQWIDNIGVNVSTRAGAFLGSLSIHMIDSDYSDVLGLPEAELRYTNKAGQTKELQWLKWLLLEGDRVIVSDFDFAPSRQGRTGLGIMVKRRGGWKVPSQFAGTSRDNFVTRAFDGIEDDIEIIIRQELTKGIKGIK